MPDRKNALIGFIMKANKATYLANDRGFDEWYVKQYEHWLEQEASVENSKGCRWPSIKFARKPFCWVKR